MRGTARPPGQTARMAADDHDERVPPLRRLWRYGARLDETEY